MLQHHQVFLIAAVGDHDAMPGGFGGHEEFILSHLAIADQARRLDGVLAEAFNVLASSGAHVVMSTIPCYRPSAIRAAGDGNSAANVLSWPSIASRKKMDNGMYT